MRSIKVLIFLVNIFLIFSCNEKKDTPVRRNAADKYTHSLKLTGEIIKIPIDSVTLPVGPLAVNDISDYNNRYLVQLNSQQRMLQVYNWKDKELINRIELPAEIDNPTYFYYINHDSILITNSHKYSLYLINEKGTINKKFSLLVGKIDHEIAQTTPPSQASTEKYVALPLPDNRNPMVRIGPYMILRCVPWIDPFNPKYFELGKLRMKVNLSIDNDISYFLGYPEIFQNNNKYPTKFFNESSTFNSYTRQLIFDFPAEEYLYVTDINGVNVTKYWAGSEFFDQVQPMSSFSENNIKQAEHAMNNSFFERILFDPFKNVYYRMVWHPDKENQYSFRDSSKEINIDLGVIILDKDFRKIGEVILPKSITNTFWFPSPEGLYIQSDVGDTANLSFQLFQLVEL